jgi:GxxExxY protein
VLIAEDVTQRIIGAAIEVHRFLGPGLMESAYEGCLCAELGMQNVSFRRQVAVPLIYKGLTVDCDYRIDLIVQDAVVVELKAVEKMLAVHEAQLLTYMKLTGLRVGLLINFNVPLLKDGIVRRVL